MLKEIEIFSCLVFMIFLIYIFKNREIFINYSGPLWFPILGNAYMLIFYKSEDLLLRIYQIINTYKKPVRFWLGPYLILIFTNLHQIEQLMTSPKYSHKADLYQPIRAFLGNGLISNSGQLWKVHRKIIQPIFNTKFVNNSIHIFEAKIDSLLEALEQNANGNVFDIQEAMSSYSTDCIGVLLLGMDFKDKEYKRKFVEAAHEIYILIFKRMTKPWLYIDFTYNCTSDGKTFKKHSNFFDNIFKKCISVAQNKRNKSIITVENYKQPIVYQLLNYSEKNPGKFKEGDLLDHLKTLFFASADTISLASAVLCMLLGMYPECQQKAYKEIQEIFGKNTPRNITPHEASQLRYLDMCIKETLRLFPAAPYIFRKPSEDTDLMGSIIPKDTNILIPIFNLHRDTKYWEKPDEFYPEHFLPEKVKERSEYVYMPFSKGTRACIGKSLAMMTIKLTVANVLTTFALEADGKISDINLRMDISVRPTDGSLVRLKRRQ